MRDFHTEFVSSWSRRNKTKSQEAWVFTRNRACPRPDKRMVDQDTSSSSSKRFRRSAGTDTRSPTGLTQWMDLPSELQRRILVSCNLSLCDLAKLAILGGVFQELYLERCAEEEQWLKYAAVSVFGAWAVNGLMSLLPNPLWRCDSVEGFPSSGGVIMLKEGEPWPDLRPSPKTHLADVQQPARFTPTDIQNLRWKFHMEGRSDSRTISLLEESVPGSWSPILHIGFIGNDFKGLTCFMYPRIAAHFLPCLGLVYLACKKAAEESLCKPCVPSLRWRPGYAWVWKQELPELYQHWPLNQMPGVPPDAQRAFAAINMRSHIPGRGNILALCMQWQGVDPDRIVRAWLKDLAAYIDNMLKSSRRLHDGEGGRRRRQRHVT
eukprot:jgi/Botrbrau1/23117/Bobra.0243s0049.2